MRITVRLGVGLAALAAVALTPTIATAATPTAATPTASSDQFGRHVQECAQTMGFSATHNPGMHQGKAGWDGMTCSG